MKKIVITGGCQGGKTTVIKAIQKEFFGKILIVKEVATTLLKNGFPVPGKDIEWSEDWQEAFQEAILPLQKSMEKVMVLKAENEGKKLIVCDRGILDGAAYTPGGPEAFCKKFGVDLEKTIQNYNMIIHLESLSTIDPEKYGKKGNAQRFEPLKRAQEIELATRIAWEKHPRRMMVGGERGIKGKISEVIGIIKLLLLEN